MLCISCHFILLQPLTLRMDHVKLLDVLTSLPVSQAILPRAVCFATSRPTNHAICSFIDSSGYVSGPIRIRLFIDYIINRFIVIVCTCAILKDRPVCFGTSRLKNRVCAVTRCALLETPTLKSNKR